MCMKYSQESYIYLLCGSIIVRKCCENCSLLGAGNRFIFIHMFKCNLRKRALIKSRANINICVHDNMHMQSHACTYKYIHFLLAQTIVCKNLTRLVWTKRTVKSSRLWCTSYPTFRTLFLPFAEGIILNCFWPGVYYSNYEFLQIIWLVITMVYSKI